MHICSKEFSCRGGGQEHKVNFKKPETTKRRQSAAKTNDNRWIGQKKEEENRKRKTFKNDFIQTWNISKPAMSKIPMKEAPWRLVRSRALLMRWTSQRNRRSYVAFAKASTAKSAWRTSRREIVNKGKIRDLTTYKQNINKHEVDKKSLINKHVNRTQ